MATKRPIEMPVEQLQARLRHLSETLDELVEKAKAKGTRLEADYLEGIEALRADIRRAEIRLIELRTHGNSDWHTVMEGVEEAWQELEAAFRRVAED